MKGKGPLMKPKGWSFLPALIVSCLLFSISCNDEKTVTEEVHLLYWDIYGNAEFEVDGDYPPPDNLDNMEDDLIVVTLRFGEQIAEFEENDVYGYFITVDKNPVNYAFKFVPSGRYWLEAEFAMMDSCFYDKTDKFLHTDTTDTVVELRPTFLGVNRGCFDLILSSAKEEEYVQLSERCWVTKKVYERFYNNKPGFGDITRP
ncbi:MAG: hypothetical protein JRK26_06435 [Deltaproteobacteria bacterium]|nr:hypothetical protein [Deltaproteobacteria bacterium]